MINIDDLISKATKSRNPSLGVYRLIKAEFLRWVKDNPGKKFDETTEQKIPFLKGSSLVSYSS